MANKKRLTRRKTTRPKAKRTVKRKPERPPTGKKVKTRNPKVIKRQFDTIPQKIPQNAKKSNQPERITQTFLPAQIRADASQQFDFDETLQPNQLAIVNGTQENLNVSPETENFLTLAKVLQQLSQFAKINIELFSSLVSNILSASNSIVQYGFELFQPVWVAGYRMTKSAVVLLFDASSWIFQQWFVGTVIVSLIGAFPSIGSGGVSVSSVAVSSFQKAALGFASVIINQIPKPFLLAALTLSGVAANQFDLVNRASTSVVALFKRIIGVPVTFVETTISASMNSKWRQGGWKSVLFYMSSLFAATLGLWLVTPQIIDLISRQKQPQILFDIQAFISSNLFVNDSSFIVRFKETCLWTFTALGLSTKDIDATEEGATQLFSIMNGFEYVRGIYDSSLMAVGRIFSGISLVQILSGSVLSSSFQQFETIEQYSNFFTENVDFLVILPAIVGEAVTGTPFFETEQSIRAQFDSANSLENFQQLFFRVDPNRILSQLSSLGFVERILVCIKIIQAICATTLARFSTPLRLALSLAFSLVLVGVAFWFLIKRSPLDAKKFLKTANKFAIHSKQFQILIGEQINWFELEKLVEYENSDLVDAINNKNLSDFLSAFEKTANELEQELLILASQAPSNPVDNVLTNQTIPKMLNELTKQKAQISLREFGPVRSNAPQPEIEAALERANNAIGFF